MTFLSMEANPEQQSLRSINAKTNTGSKKVQENIQIKK
jgi:hypothetical protein